jgi:hypothetical protein
MTGYNPFAGMREAKTFGSGNYLEPGNYKLEIVRMLWQKLNAGGEALIVEFKILESNNEKHKVGGEASWFQKANESFLSESKLFLYAATGHDVKNDAHQKRIKEQIEPACEGIMLHALQSNAFKGRQVFVKVFHKPKKKKADEIFSKHVFAPAQPPMGQAA